MLLNRVKGLETKYKETDKDDEPILICKKCQLEAQNNFFNRTHERETQNILM